MISQSDDVNTESCENKEKSYVNLSNLNVGEYILAIGGFKEEHGSYLLQLRYSHSQYSFPIVTHQLNPKNNIGAISELKCGEILSNQHNTELSNQCSIL